MPLLHGFLYWPDPEAEYTPEEPSEACNQSAKIQIGEIELVGNAQPPFGYPDLGGDYTGDPAVFSSAYEYFVPRHFAFLGNVSKQQNRAFGNLENPS
jgi:hypothetical protein